MKEQKKSLIDKLLEFGVGKTLSILYVVFLFLWMATMLLLNFYIKWREKL